MFRKSSISAFALLAVQAPMAAFAQSADTQSDREEDADTPTNTERDVFSDVIVVTGRAGGRDLRQVESSYAITVIDADALELDAPRSAAEVFNLVPGFWVESSGGEGSNNVRSRGIPFDGYSSVALQENGLSIQYDGGLGYLNADQSFRYDATVERVEAVRGGPASIFAPNAPGGVVNFISRKGGEGTGGYLSYEYGDYDHHRVDGYYGGGKGGFRWLVGGFYRKDDGLRDPGFTANEGGQIRATVGYDGPGASITFDAQYLDDKVAFYLPVPLTFDANGDIAEIPGFDAQNGTLAGPENAFVDILSPDGGFGFDLTEGSHTEQLKLTATGSFDLGGGTGLEVKARYRDADILRNGLFPTGSIQSAADFASSSADTSGVPAEAVQLRYASDGTPFTADANGNGLIIFGNLLSVSVPIDEMILDARVTKQIKAVGEHDFTIGATWAGYQYRFDRYMGTALLEVADQARRLDAVIVDAEGNDAFGITDNGFLRYGSLYNNVGIDVEAIAFYAGDEWQVTPELRIDVAGRYEKTSISGLVEGVTTVDLGNPTTAADDNVSTGTGTFTAVDQTFDDWGWTLGANYQFMPDAGVFARYTDTFSLPSAGAYNGSPTRDDQASVPIKQAELGLKYDGGIFSIFATGFWTKFEGVRFTDFFFNNNTQSFEERRASADTETFGVEVEAFIKPTDFFDLLVQATYQNAEYKGFVFNEVVDGELVERNFDGNQLIRIPELMVRAVPAINLFDGRFRVEGEIEHFTKRFPDVANSTELPAFTVLSANARAQLTENIRLTAHVDNITNEIGLTEGNPRAGSFIAGDAGAEFYVARPIFGRTFRASVAVTF